MTRTLHGPSKPRSDVQNAILESPDTSVSEEAYLRDLPTDCYMDDLEDRGRNSCPEECDLSSRSADSSQPIWLKMLHTYQTKYGEPLHPEDVPLEYESNSGQLANLSRPTIPQYKSALQWRSGSFCTRQTLELNLTQPTDEWIQPKCLNIEWLKPD